MALVRRPNAADRAAAAATTPPSPEYAANRIRLAFTADLDAAKAIASKIHKLVTKHGRAAVETALAADGAELVPCYGALKTYITTLDPAAVVPDLPA
jgi:hypothetical protein